MNETEKKIPEVLEVLGVNKNVTGYPATIRALRQMLTRYEEGERLPYGGNMEQLLNEVRKEEQIKSQPYSIYLSIWRIIEELNHSVLMKYTKKVMIIKESYITPYDFLYLVMKLVKSWDYIY